MVSKESMQAVGRGTVSLPRLARHHRPHGACHEDQRNTVILAIDLGKYKSLACLYEPNGGEVKTTTLDTNRFELARLIESRRPGVVVIEACALSGWVSDLCGELGVPCRVANTASEAWKFKHAKRKTDRDDALRLAQLQALSQLPVVVVPPKPTREWRSLIAGRQALVCRRVALQTGCVGSCWARVCRCRAACALGARRA